MMDKVYRSKLSELYKLVVARSDITASMDSCDLMLKHVKNFFEDYKHGLYMPILHAIIICYARPFTENKPFGRLKDKWAKYSSREHKDIHKNLIDLRNKMIAHSDFMSREVIVYPKGTKMPKPLNYESADIGVAVSFKALGLSYIREIKNMCYDLGARLNNEVNRLLEELFSDERIPKRPINLREILHV
jgi:hypothetical protein